MNNKNIKKYEEKMKVFITGATGYIGFNVAQSFRRAGHQVYGLTRSSEKAKVLAKYEIVPIIGSIQNLNNFAKYIEESDAVVHAAADYNNNFSELEKSTVKEIINLLKRTEKIKKLIYTSGMWVYGNSNNNVITEKTDVNPIKIVNWRIEVENIVVNNPYINGVVIRPGCVYGKKGDMTNDFFNSMLNKNEINIIGNGENHWPMIHADDLANAYLLAAEKNIGNEIFNIAEEESHSIKDIILGIRELINFNGKINYIPLKNAIDEMGDFAEALAIDQRVDTSKAKQLLNWKPKHTGFFNELDLYNKTWNAFQDN